MLRNCARRVKVCNPLMIEGLGEPLWACPLCSIKKIYTLRTISECDIVDKGTVENNFLFYILTIIVLNEISKPYLTGLSQKNCLIVIF